MDPGIVTRLMSDFSPRNKDSSGKMQDHMN